MDKVKVEEISMREFAEKYMVIVDVGGMTRKFNKEELDKIEEIDKHIQNNEQLVLIRKRGNNVLKWVNKT